MILRVRSRDGLERVTVENPHTATVWHLKALIQAQLGIPYHDQTLSTDHNLLLAKTPHDLARFADMAESAPLASLGLSHGSFVFLLYAGERTVSGPGFSPAGSFGRKTTIADLAAALKGADSRRAGCTSCDAHAPAAKRGGWVSGESGLAGKFEKLGLND